MPTAAANDLLPAVALADAAPPLPEAAEIDLVRHFVNLSTKNMAIDTNFYPLGSCTMKYNPKRHERLAALPGMAELHPLQSDASCQGMLELLWEMQNILGEIAGLDGVSLQPAAGAQGELAALLVAAAYFRDRGEQRTRVLIPDSAHGTNPASAAIAGFDAVTIKSNGRGLVDLADLTAKLDARAAVFMITNPNTLGIFDHQIAEITDLVHRQEALVYLDGANMNAILGVTRPGDFGVDMMHYNVHKTFTGPHGAGGPGARANRRTRAVDSVSAGADCSENGRRFSSRLQPSQVDWSGAEFLRQRGYLVARLALHPHPRAGRPARSQRRRRSERQLSVK